MQELLEEIKPKAVRAFRKQVSWNELTVLSLNGPNDSALILTNRFLYLVKKGFLRLKCHKFSFREILEVSAEDKEIRIVYRRGRERLKFIQLSPELLDKATGVLHTYIFQSP